MSSTTEIAFSELKDDLRGFIERINALDALALDEDPELAELMPAIERLGAIITVAKMTQILAKYFGVDPSQVQKQ